jgi:hypothetical protein
VPELRSSPLPRSGAASLDRHRRTPPLRDPVVQDRSPGLPTCGMSPFACQPPSSFIATPPLSSSPGRARPDATSSSPKASLLIAAHSTWHFAALCGPRKPLQRNTTRNTRNKRSKMAAPQHNRAKTARPSDDNRKSPPPPLRAWSLLHPGPCEALLGRRYRRTRRVTVPQAGCPSTADDKVCRDQNLQKWE